MQYIKYHAQNAPRNMLAKPQECLRKEQQSIPDGAERSTKNNCCNLQKKNDGIAYHHHYTGHQIDFDNVEIITQEKSYWRRLIIEGMEIKWLGEDRANLQLGYEVHECWDPILAKLHCIPTNTGT